VNLLDRRSDLLVTRIEALRDAVRKVRGRTPFRIDAWVERRLRAIDARLMQRHKANPVSRRLAAIPGVGPIGALSFALRVDAAQFKSARRFAAWLGLVPR